MQRAVCVGDHKLDLDEQSKQIPAATAFPAQLVEHLQHIELRLPAFSEKTLGQVPQVGVQSHLVHDGRGCPHLVRANAPVRLGQVTHDGEGGREEGGLGAFPGVELHVAGPVYAAPADIEVVSQGGPEQCPEGAAEYIAEGTANDFAPPTHARRTSYVG